MQTVSLGTATPLSTCDVVHLLQAADFTAAQKKLTLGDPETSVELFIRTAATPCKRPIAACHQPETVRCEQAGESFFIYTLTMHRHTGTHIHMLLLLSWHMYTSRRLAPVS